MERSERRRMWLYALTGMLLMITTTGFARMSYGAIMPYMQEGLKLTYAQAGFLGTLISFGYLLTVLAAGLFASRWGEKTVIVSGALLVVFGLFGLSWVPSFPWAVLLATLIGMGSATAFVPLISLMVASFPQQRGLVLGFLLSGTGIAMLVSGLIVPVQIALFSNYSWRYSWFLFAVVSVLTVLLATAVLKNPPRREGSAVYPNKSTVISDKEVLKIAALYFSVGVAYLIPILFQTGYMLEAGITSSTAGVVFAIAGVFGVFGGPFWGFFSDRLDRKFTLLLALATAVAGALLPVVWTNLWGFLLSAIILGLTTGGLMVLIQAAVSVQVPPPLLSAAVGFTTFFFACGQMIGPGAAGWMIDHAGGFMGAYLFSTCLYALGLGIGCTIHMRNRANLQSKSKVKAE